MILVLQALPQLAGPDGDGYHGLAPRRALYMRPEAAAALLAVEDDTGGLVYTDIYRSPQAILQAYRTKVTPSGQHYAQPVAYSFHGYGGCVDVDTDASARKLGTNYDGLVSILEARGFHCHRRDGNPTASESWHFNFLGDAAGELLALTTADHATWAAPAEAMIQTWYGPELELTDDQVDTLLPIAHATDVADFQRKWDLTPDGIAGPRTRRVLAFVTATMQVA